MQYNATSGAIDGAKINWQKSINLITLTYITFIITGSKVTEIVLSKFNAESLRSIDVGSDRFTALPRTISMGFIF